MDIRTRLKSHNQFLEDVVLSHTTGLRDIVIHLLATHNINNTIANQALNVLDAIDFFSISIPKNELASLYWTFDYTIKYFNERVTHKNVVTLLNNLCLKLYSTDQSRELILARRLETIIKREAFKHLLDKNLITQEQLATIRISSNSSYSNLDFDYDDIEFTDEQALFKKFRHLKVNKINPKSDYLVEELGVGQSVTTDSCSDIVLIKKRDDNIPTGPTRTRYKSLENYLNFNKGLTVVFPHPDGTNAATVFELVEVDEPKHQAPYRTLDAIIDELIKQGFLPKDERTKPIINPFTGETLTAHPHYKINRIAGMPLTEDHIFYNKIQETNGEKGLHIAEVDNKPLIIFNLDRKTEFDLVYKPDGLSITTLTKEVNH